MTPQFDGIHERRNGSGYTTHKNQVVRFEIDKPVYLWLDTAPATAEQVDSQYGSQWQYFARSCDRAQGLIFWADPKLHAQLLATAPAGNVDIAICKRKKGRSNLWETSMAQDGAATGPDPAEQEAPGWVGSNLHGDAWEPPPNTQSYLPPARATAPRPAQMPQRQPAPPQASDIRPEEVRMLRAYQAAIGIVAHAVAFARDKHGLQLTPDMGDVRATAATLYIEQSKRLA